MDKYTVMPLLNSSFEPGKAREIVAGFEDVDVRNIAQAELFISQEKRRPAVRSQNII